MAEIRTQLSRDPQALPGDLRLLPAHARPARHLRGHAGGARGVLGEALRLARASACGRATSATYSPTARPTPLISDFVARKIRERVKDPATAEKLIPKNHGFGTRRVPLETKYYEVYNQPNVRLVDIKRNADRAHHADRHQDQRRRIRVRHHHLRHGLRRHHRQLRPHRHPRHGRAQAEGQVEGRPADLSRRAGRGLPQHVHADGPAHRAGQHPAQRSNTTSSG